MTHATVAAAVIWSNGHDLTTAVRSQRIQVERRLACHARRQMTNPAAGHGRGTSVIAAVGRTRLGDTR
jgi:hypothetical protein